MEKRYVAWAEEAGLFDGTDPQSPVTREEAAHMIQRALDHFFACMIRALQES